MKKKEVLHPLIGEIRDRIPLRFEDENTLEALQNLINDWRKQFDRLEEIERKYQQLSRSVRENFGLLAELVGEPSTVPLSVITEKINAKLNDRGAKIEELEANLNASRTALRDVQIKLYELMNPTAPADSANGDPSRLATEVARYVGDLEEQNVILQKELDVERKKSVALESAYNEAPKQKSEEKLYIKARKAVDVIRSCEPYDVDVANAMITLGRCVEAIAARLKM